MSYSTQPIAQALKAARARKGLSQRALSTLSGVPQAHISKIEQNAVDLRLTSLLAMAHALDLELALVPKKAIPAVQSIARTTTAGPPAATSKEWARTLQAAQRMGEALKTPEMEKLQKQLGEMSRLISSSIEPETLRTLRKTIETINAATGSKAAQDAIRQATHIQNAIAHSVDPKAITPPRPAYRLDGDDDA
jgi:transcriptional regulator with XRE-family HTH domain